MALSLRAEQSAYCRPAKTLRTRGPNCSAQERLGDGGDAVPAFFLREALNKAGMVGTDCAEVLEQAGIDPAVLDEANDTEITADQFGRFWNTYADSMNDEFFGQDERGLPRGSFILMCHAVLSAHTLEQAMLRMLRFYRVLLSDFDASLVRDGDIAEIVLKEAGPPRTAFAYLTFFVVFLGVSHWLIDRRMPLLEIEFRSPTDEGADHYRRLLGDNLEFGRPQTRIRFSSEFLALKPMRNEAQMETFRRDSPQSLIAQYRSRDSVSARVWSELRRSRPDEWPGFEDLASRLYTTSSTLRRRLEAEGTSYQRIKDEVRREQAIQYLRQNEMSNADIAEELGFGDPSTFYRAFRKWTGATPNAYRRPVRAVN